MTATLVALGGVIIGAVLAQLGAALSDRRQTRAEATRWRRDQLASAYAQTLRYLHRAAHRRSEFLGGRGAAVLRPEHQREWFDDLVEAQVWLRAVTRYCEPARLDRIREAADLLDTHVERLVSGERFDEKDFSILGVLQFCIAAVTDGARSDSGSPARWAGDGSHDNAARGEDNSTPPADTVCTLCGSPHHVAGNHNLGIFAPEGNAPLLAPESRPSGAAERA